MPNCLSMASSGSHNHGGGGGNKPSRAGSAGKTSPIPHTRLEEEGQFEKLYTVGDKLGEGSFGIVKEVIHKTTGERWACKAVNKDNSKEKSWGYKIKLLEREVNILKKVNHEHIIKLKEVFETSQKMYLVMSLCEGGELSKELKRLGQLPENETRVIMGRLASAISYLHKNDMVHRDLKLENILLSNNPHDKEDRLYIKVTDFGLSVVKGGVGHENMMMDFCGTPMYMAPEIIDNKSYSEKCDVWALGVIMHMLLTGLPPSIGQDDEQLYAQIKNLDIKDHVHSNRTWEGISEECKDCIVGMMNLDPAHRFTASEVLIHPWVTGGSLDPAQGPRNVLEMMKAWGNDLTDDEITPNSSNSAINTSNSNNHGSLRVPSSRGGQPTTEDSSEGSGPPSRNGSASSGKIRKSPAGARKLSVGNHMPPSTGTRKPGRTLSRNSTEPVLHPPSTGVVSSTRSGAATNKTRTNSLTRSGANNNAGGPKGTGGSSKSKSPTDPAPQRSTGTTGGTSRNLQSQATKSQGSKAPATSTRGSSKQSSSDAANATSKTRKKPSR